MPHWFSYVGSLKLYQPLAGILRFVGLSLVSWYDRHGSGQLLRQASTAACMLNEIIFGISERASNDFASIFHNCAFHTSFWKMPKNKGVRSYLVECIGGILHEYLAAEVGQLVLENADYVVDSICRQLRHLDLNHHVPNVLASMLSYIGVAHKILPLLEEPHA
ncbi:uncharacterized protein LOC114183473 [Vigna unguiculata]|uniref:uncharacterized protein LOC114183473 n=1 Tax=Vigna unguiculata TaxID=3917 RepID=UPI001015F6B4|nr:uncharacterized protein LOC114183473 [Vigna unguiculata]